jgi:hypothetical protein
MEQQDVIDVLQDYLGAKYEDFDHQYITEQAFERVRQDWSVGYGKAGELAVELLDIAEKIIYGGRIY